MRLIAETEREFEKEAMVAWAEVDRLTEEAEALRARLREAGVPVVQPRPHTRPVPISTALDAVGPRGVPRPVLPAPRISERRRSEARPVSEVRIDPDVESALAPLEAGWRRLIAVGVTPRTFWDGVMREVVLVIRASGEASLTVAKILDRLPDEIRRKSHDFEALDVGVLKEKLAFRASKGKYVRRVGGDRFGVLEGA